jgi:hypothetical protein
LAGLTRIARSREQGAWIEDDLAGADEYENY